MSGEGLRVGARWAWDGGELLVTAVDYSRAIPYRVRVTKATTNYPVGYEEWTTERLLTSNATYVGQAESGQP